MLFHKSVEWKPHNLLVLLFLQKIELL